MFYVVTDPGDERSRQLRHAMESGIDTSVTWVGTDGEPTVTRGRVVECREKIHEGKRLEEWVMEVREESRSGQSQGSSGIALKLSLSERPGAGPVECPDCGGEILGAGQCPHCGKQISVRGIDGVFLSDAGEESKGPPLHDGCTCETRLFFFDGAYWVEWLTPIMAECSRCIAFDTKLKGWENENFPSDPVK